MKIKDWKRKLKEKGWQPYFAWFPIRLDNGDTVWFEWAEKRLVGWYGDLPHLQWEYRTKDGEISS